MAEYKQQLKIICDHAAVGLALIDATSGRLLQTNEYFWKYLGLGHLDLGTHASGEIFVSDILAHAHPDDRALRDAELQRLFSGEIDNFSVDIRYRHKDGSWHWFNSTVTSTWQPGSPPTVYVAVVQDINKKKSLEFSLRRSEDLLTRTLNSLTEAVFVINPRSRQIEIYNQAACEMFGFSGDELLKINTRRLHVDDEHYREFARRSEALLKRGQGFLGEFEMRRADGHVFATEHEIHAISLQASGWQERVVSVIRDISERKHKELELLKLSQALEQSPVASLLTDRDCRIEYVNKQYTQLTGYAKEEVLGEGVPAVDRNAALCGLESRLRKSTAQTKEWRGRLSCQRRHDGTFLAQATISPIFNEEGNCSHYLLTLIDITEKHALQKASEQASRLAAVGTLAAGVAHEINNPNSIIMLNLRALQAVWNDVTAQLDALGGLSLGGLKYPEQREDLFQLLSDSLESSHRIKSIVADLKSFSTDDGGASTDEIPLKSIDLNEVVKTAFRLTASIIKTSTDHFSLELEDDLPKVRGIFLRLEQVVVNLLLNACQALSSRQQAVKVKTLFDAKMQCSLIEVHDQGEGIPEKYQQQILDPFFTTRRAEGGSGLGLSVSNTIVKEHGGKIIISSAIGEGSCISIALPIGASKEGT